MMNAWKYKIPKQCNYKKMSSQKLILDDVKTKQYSTDTSKEWQATDS
jgi:hypothetical protein